jgi:hypothetical protein
MLKTKDQNTLEFLYEQINNNLLTQLLPEEQTFIDILAKRYAKEIIVCVKRMDVTTSGFFLDQIFFINPVQYDLDALQIEDLDLKNDVWKTLNEFVLRYLNSRMVFLHKTKYGPFVFFKDMYVIDNSFDYKDPIKILISKENEQVIINYFKKLISELILYLYNNVLHTKQESKNWVEWRNHQFKLKNLKQKLPEIKGIF